LEHVAGKLPVQAIGIATEKEAPELQLAADTGSEEGVLVQLPQLSRWVGSQ